MFRSLIPILIILTAHGMAHAQAPAPEDRDLPALPPAPPDQILDEAGLLDPSTRAALREHVQKLSQQFDVKLFIAAYTLLPEKDHVRARRLRMLWGGDSRSVVIVYRRGSQQLTFSANGHIDTFIPTRELLLMYKDAVTAARTFETPRERILAAVETLSAAIIRDLTVRDAKRGFFTAEIFTLIAAICITILVIGGASFLLVRRLQLRAHKREIGCVFPEVTVGRRLGAPFGGGTVAGMHFAKSVQTGQSSDSLYPSSQTRTVPTADRA